MVAPSGNLWNNLSFSHDASGACAGSHRQRAPDATPGISAGAKQYCCSFIASEIRNLRVWARFYVHNLAQRAQLDALALVLLIS